MLRHTAGTRIYKRNNNELMTMARILGHANLNTTAIYAKLDAEGLLEAMDNAERILSWKCRLARSMILPHGWALTPKLSFNTTCRQVV